jgi:hypothetical protein
MTPELSSFAKRPKNLLLSNQKFLKTFGIQLGPWQQQLDEVLAEMREDAILAGNGIGERGRGVRDLIGIDEVC